ncbi:MAG: hypothetical protein HY000_01930 [Planctomycetes bacterium]|nr:hypothetical protein [Planctomycetota bacterium]
MNIERIFSRFGPGGITSPKSESLATVEEPQGNSPASAPASSRFREILSRYDVHHISPREFSELVQKLFDAGEITQAEVQELSLLRLELDKRHADADQPLDLVRFLQDQLRQQEDEINRQNRHHPEQPIDRDAALRLTRRQLEWMEKFASVQAGRFSGALDQVI